MKLERETALIEAVLFLEAEPVDLKALMKATDLPTEAVQEALENLKTRSSRPDQGLELVQIGGGYLLAPKEELWDFLKDRYGKKNDNRLSRAALETLSIIAYSQPITKGEIENIRGVSADNMIRTLVHKGLVHVTGKKEAPGHPALYGTTKEFLKAFRLSSIADLPKLDEKEAERFELNG